MSSSSEDQKEKADDVKYKDMDNELKERKKKEGGVGEGYTDPEDKKAVHEHHELTILSSFKTLFLSSWINLLLVAVPVGIVVGAMNQPQTVVFIINFLAIIPLAKLLGESTEQIATRTGQAIGALLNATFGNAVELIVSIIALKEGLIRVVQGSLIGSVLSNLLLVLGMCFVAGGIKYHKQKFNQAAAQTSGGILLMAVFGALLPAALQAQLSTDSVVSPNVTDSITDTSDVLHPDPQTNAKLLTLSRGASIILLIVYGLFLYFQLGSHKEMYEDKDGEEEEPEMLLWFAILSLLLITVLVAVCAEYLVGSIEGIVDQWGISESFVGLIVLPIVGNAAEHVTAVTVAYKDKMDLAIGVAIGSSQQIALMVTPLLVLLGWIIGQPMSLYFEVFETAVLFICVIVVNALIMDGESNWLEGVMLLAVYIISAIAFYVI